MTRFPQCKSHFNKTFCHFIKCGKTDNSGSLSNDHIAHNKTVGIRGIIKTLFPECDGYACTLNPHIPPVVSLKFDTNTTFHSFNFFFARSGTSVLGSFFFFLDVRDIYSLMLNISNIGSSLRLWILEKIRKKWVAFSDEWLWRTSFATKFYGIHYPLFYRASWFCGILLVIWNIA